MYGTGIFLEDAINNIIHSNYAAIIDAAGKQVVSAPEFDIVSMDDKEIVLKAEMYVKPDVTIEGYKGIEASVVLAPVTDEEIDREVDTVRERNAREIEITDRPAEMGDTAVIDYEGFVDGVAFEGGKDSGHHLKLGSGQFIPGFEEGIVGKNIGEEFDVNVTFPTEYGAKELAGKAAVFKVKLNAIEKTELPAADDDLRSTYPNSIHSLNTAQTLRQKSKRDTRMQPTTSLRKRSRMLSPKSLLPKFPKAWLTQRLKTRSEKANPECRCRVSSFQCTSSTST